MPLPLSMSAKKISKSTLSMFLRTRCDKELYLSLHNKETMGAAGLPEPVKRPGIGRLSTDGQEFEIERNDQLVRLFSNLIRYNKGSKSYNDVELETYLLSETIAPVIILQGKFSITSQKTQTLQNIGLSPADIANIPEIADFIPDVLIIHEPYDGDIEVLTNGFRQAINQSQERRLGIDIFDVKHTSEANPSYCAEIAMYALMLANWLHHHPVLKDRYYVTTNAYLWTRFKQGESALDQLEQTGSATTEELLKALVADSEDANLRFYIASVRRFLEDVARVIRIGDSTLGAWTNLEWHVNSTCSNCDWLGDKRHLGNAQKVRVDANPAHYCMPAASMSGHLCLVPGITRGAKKILQSNAVSTTGDLANAAGHSALQEHTVLKRDARNLPVRSVAILSGSISNDQNAVIASLVPSANLLLFASVNFDSSSGLLTGLALSGVATNFTAGQSPRRFQSVPYVVDEKTLNAEWVALEAFLSNLGDCINTAESLVTSGLKGQIHFWDERQFKELCNAMGRHLPRVLALSIKKVKSLAWIFPPEEFLARPESLEASTVVIVEDIVRRMVFTPTPHVITLFDTAEHYPSNYVQTERDSYYREYLNNGIPRERIYEIWSNTPQLKRGTAIFPRNTLITAFSNALAKQSKALESVCERLRTDYRGQFKAKATSISTTIPQGATQVAFDGKLWIWWDSLNFNASQLEAHIRLSLDGERLEATYEAIVLKNGTQLSQTLYEFDVASGSTEAKFKEDSMLTLGKLGRPGMPLEHATAILSSTSPPFLGDPNVLHFPLWSVLKVKLKQFDRVQAKAHVEITYDNDPQFVPYLMANSSVDLLADVFLLESKSPKSFDWSIYSKDILKEIGNPAIAVPDQNAADAMGLAPTARRGGKKTTPTTMAAHVLWNAESLEQKTVISSPDSNAIASYVTRIDGLNPSQTAAVEHAAERALTIIWGPPGTGKTNTLAALIHGLTQDAVAQGQSLKVLVTGPTYKAVEEVMNRSADLLSKDSTASGSMYVAYSRGRALGIVPTGLSNHVSYTPISIDQSDVNYQQFLAELNSSSGVVILGCQIRQSRRFPNELMGSFVQPLFDVVIIDESSQVPVSYALSALCGLKDDARLIIAGDYLQMPPITSIEPPTDAAYLVGSIQTYLLKRQFSQPVQDCILETNYRSNDHIVEFAKKIGYPPTLQSHFPNTALNMMSPLPPKLVYPATLPWCEAFSDILTPNHKVVTLLHEDDVSSQGNHFEARVVAGAVWMLRQSVSAELDGRGTVNHVTPTPEHFWDKCLGIVTPHRAQRALVIRELEQLFPGEKDFIDSAVDTVERFQGGQRHTIIVTFGIGDTDVISGEESFLMQLERTNVAVSRAMAKCIVVMPKTLAEYIPEDRKALATAFALKDYIEEFCNIRIETTLSDDKQTRWAQVRYHQ
ncbi:DEAD/DEAH box helicase [Altericista sp. CCNU0014]|uniref:DEAD/DEAH box helicase n=1 Tax=Altericista sp. CCNU0014 TaxID=3082949 RepID=UPI00384D204A